MLSEINQFVNWVRRRSPGARTWKDYSYDLAQFTALLGDIPARAVTFREIDRFVFAQSSHGFQPSTINRRLATLVSFFTFLSEEDESIICPVIPRRHMLRELAGVAVLRTLQGASRPTGISSPSTRCLPAPRRRRCTGWSCSTRSLRVPSALAVTAAEFR